MSKEKTKTIFSIRFKKLNKKVLEFANLQSNFSDAVSYLIEKEIAENGLRDLSDFIPAKRSLEYLSSQKSDKKLKQESQRNKEKIQDDVKEEESIEKNNISSIIPEEYLDF